MSCSNWSSDLSSGKTHYSDNGFGSPANMADDNLATYCQQMSYVSVSGINDIVSRLRLAVHNTTARNKLASDEPIFQGSNNSTNGSDGSWTTIMTINASDVGTPSYPGWAVDKEFTNNTLYDWYRLSGITKNNENVYNEWELFSCEPSFYFSGYVYELGSTVSRKLYLYKRDDGSLINSTTSSGNGYYYLETTYSGSHYIVCLDNEAGEDYNDMIIGNVLPTTLSG